MSIMVLVRNMFRVIVRAKSRVYHQYFSWMTVRNFSILNVLKCSIDFPLEVVASFEILFGGAFITLDLITRLLMGRL